jgi:hypothetical protein
MIENTEKNLALDKDNRYSAWRGYSNGDVVYKDKWKNKRIFQNW